MITSLALGLIHCQLVAGLAVAAQEKDSLYLETSAARIEIRKSPTPYIARIVHKKSNMAVVESPGDKSLFTVTLEEGNNRQVLSSTQAKKSTAVLENTSTGTKAILTFSQFDASNLTVEIVGTALKTEPLVRWSICVKGGHGKRLSAVRFPIVHAVPALGSSEDDFLVLPALPGVLIENPWQNWPLHQSVTLQFPGNMSAQFLAYQDSKAGIYLAGMDPANHAMSLSIAKRPNSFAIHHEYLPGMELKQDWVSPYPVVLGVTQGKWYDTADQYKRWAVQQSWCAKTLSQREDIPAWWKAGPLVHVCEVRTYDSQRACTGSYYGQLLEHLRTFRDLVDGPVVPMLAGWENHRRWTAGDYFPIFDEQNARPVLRQLRKEGFRPFFYLSGLYYTFENEGRDASKIPTAEKYHAHFVVDQKTLKPRIWSLDESSPNGSWKRLSHEFCVADDATRDFFCGVIDHSHALGVDVLQMDQTVQGAGDACYSSTHGHPPGPGIYQIRDFQKLLARMREHGKKLDPEFVLLHEEPHEQLIPCLDGFHVREYYEKQWYRGYPGSVGIPLFSYLYHEYALGYGGDSAGLSPGKSPWLARCHAMNLITGRTPGAAVWSGQRNALTAHADQITMLRNHSRLLKTRAREHLLLGKMLHPLDLEVPKLRFDVNIRGKKQEVENGAILTSSWLSPAGKVGHLFINISDTKQPLSVRLDTRNAPNYAQANADIYRSSAGPDFKQLWRNAVSPQDFRTDLAPLEVVFVEIRPAR